MPKLPQARQQAAQDRPFAESGEDGVAAEVAFLGVSPCEPTVLTEAGPTVDLVENIADPVERRGQFAEGLREW